GAATTGPAGTAGAEAADRAGCAGVGTAGAVVVTAGPTTGHGRVGAGSGPGTGAAVSGRGVTGGRGGRVTGFGHTAGAGTTRIGAATAGHTGRAHTSGCATVAAARAAVAVATTGPQPRVTQVVRPGGMLLDRIAAVAFTRPRVTIRVLRVERLVLLGHALQVRLLHSPVAVVFLDVVPVGLVPVIGLVHSTIKTEKRLSLIPCIGFRTFGRHLFQRVASTVERKDLSVHRVTTETHVAGVPVVDVLQRLQRGNTTV